jgi:hypothetical protein
VAAAARTDEPGASAGMPVTEVASAWDALAGWQRGILGTRAVALAFVVMMIGVVLLA